MSVERPGSRSVGNNCGIRSVGRAAGNRRQWSRGPRRCAAAPCATTVSISQTRVRSDSGQGCTVASTRGARRSPRYARGRRRQGVRSGCPSPGCRLAAGWGRAPGRVREERVAVDGAIQETGRRQPVHAERRDKGAGLPVVMGVWSCTRSPRRLRPNRRRRSVATPLSSRNTKRSGARSAVVVRHASRAATTSGRSCSDARTVFLRVNPSCFTARQIVASPAVVLSAPCNSVRVRSGWARISASNSVSCDVRIGVRHRVC